MKKEKKTMTVQEVEKLMTTDARFKVFKEKLKKLGYVKKNMAEVRQIMEIISDFGMMSDAGNKKIARAVSQSKNEKDLRSSVSNEPLSSWTLNANLPLRITGLAVYVHSLLPLERFSPDISEP